MKPNRARDQWLDEYQGFKKYLSQCVACQEIGYDPIKIEKKEGRHFKERVTKYFHPMTLNEAGLCPVCATATAARNHDRA